MFGAVLAVITSLVLFVYKEIRYIPVALSGDKKKKIEAARQALKDISMTIEEKSVVAFIGPSGCGKSTFLRLFNRMNLWSFHERKSVHLWKPDCVSPIYGSVGTCCPKD